MTDLARLGITEVVLAFLAATAVIALAGARLVRAADRLADLTGWGEAIFGAVLLGGSTSLPGVTTSVVTAWQGFPELSVSNAIGGIAAQTVFLAVADMAHRGANLEHAAASVENLMQGALLATLLAIPLLAMAGPPLDVSGVHPASLGLFVMYGFGLRLVRQARADPLWAAKQTERTREDVTEAAPAPLPGEAVKLWLRFGILAALVSIAGWAVAETGIEIAARTGFSETTVGSIFTAISTSLPELVTAVAAVRQGALTLAVGGIIGGNCFDVLFMAFADIAYREGSIYHAITELQVFMIALTILLSGVLLLGLLRRERSGWFGIGFESFLVLVLYLGAVSILFLGP
ncbi:MAG: sodium:calcium antiporter [Gemmatimonadota bacterium]|nr:sodium:calcium antiporter [Gemmatimonadota bacterium]